MLDTTLQAVKAVLKADPSMTPDGIKAILTVAHNPTAAQPVRPFFITIKRAAELSGLTRRTINNLIHEGCLKGVKIPGRKNRLGITYESLENFTTAAQEK